MAIGEYVLLLARDPDEADRFRASVHSARTTMSAFGLSKQEQDVLLSGNAEEISQAIFAKKIKISRQYLCDIEHNRRTVSAETAASFAKKLGYSPIHFIRLALQDNLNKLGLHFDIDLHEHKDAA